MRKANALIKDSDSKDFIAYLRDQKKLILIASAFSFVCFILLKFCFPYPDFFDDSINYVTVASIKSNISYRPIGYSYFLRGLHIFSSNATFTVFIQYLLFLIANLFCFLTIDYLYTLPKKLRSFLLLFILIDPLQLLQTNMISSDSLFCSLTVSFFTLSIWASKRNSLFISALLIIFLYISFEVRYTALFYPAVAIISFVVSKVVWQRKLMSISLCIMVIFFAIKAQEDIVERGIGKRIFSGFAGWQIANNALYCYKDINIDEGSLPTEETQMLEKYIRKNYNNLPTTPGKIGYAYLWDSLSPLKTYHIMVCKYAHIGYLNAWFLVSKTYNDYGWYVIKNYPGEFFNDFILPNTYNFFYPDVEILENYNLSHETFPPVVKDWFQFSTDRLSCRYDRAQYYVIKIFPLLSLLLNVFNGIAIIFCLFNIRRPSHKLSKDAYKLLFIWCCYYLTFMIFTIFAAYVNLRFMSPIFTLGLLIPFAFINHRRASF